MSKKSNESSNKRSNNGRGFSWDSFSSRVNVFSKKNRSNEEDERENELYNGSSSSWGSIHVPYAQVSGPQSANLPPPHIIQQQQQQQRQQQQWTPKSQSNSQRNIAVPPFLLADSDVPERSFIGLSPTWNASSSLSSLPQNNNNHSDGIDNNNSNTPLQPRSSFDKSYRLNEFTGEVKFLFQDLIEYGKAKTWKKKLLTVIMCICSMVVFYDLLFGKQNYIVTWLHLFIVWMTQHHTQSVFAFVGIFLLSTLIFVPPTLLVFGAGYAFTMAMDTVFVGCMAACLSCFLGSCLGAIIAFVRSRYMMRDLIKLFSRRYPLIRVVDQALKLNHGFRIMLLLRLCPIIPFNGLNYCCGITGVTLPDFTLSLVGILPFQIYTIILGATAGALELQNLKNDDLTRSQRLAFIGFIITGVIFGLVAIVYVFRLVKQELKRELGLSTEEFEILIHPTDTTDWSPNKNTSDDGINSNKASSSGSLKDDDSQMHGTAEDIETAYSLNLQEEGEEWFWIWA